MKEIVCEGIKVTNSMNINLIQTSITSITNLMKVVVQRYQRAFANKADAFSNTIGPNTSVNRPLPALCATTHKQHFKRRSEHIALSQRSTKMTCGHAITLLLPQASFDMINEDTGVNCNAKKLGNKCGFCEQRQNHAILNCPNHNQLKERGTEHDMTIEHESLKFKHSIQSSTIISGSYFQKKRVDTIIQLLKPCHGLTVSSRKFFTQMKISITMVHHGCLIVYSSKLVS